MIALKSKIQVLKEQLDLKEHIKQCIVTLSESYDLSNQVLMYQGELKSPIMGYFDLVYVAESLEEMMVHFDPSEHVFILHEGLYKVGLLMKESSDCKSNFVIDCYSMTQLYGNTNIE